MSNQAPSRRYTQYLMPLVIASALIYQTYFVPFDSSRPISLADAHKLPAQYKNFLVIGASYNDNAHSRKLEHAASLRDYYPFNLFGGRYSNGPVAVSFDLISSVLRSIRTDAVLGRIFSPIWSSAYKLCLWTFYY